MELSEYLWSSIVQTKVAVYLCKQMNEHNKTILEYKGLLMNSFEQKFEKKSL